MITLIAVIFIEVWNVIKRRIDIFRVALIQRPVKEGQIIVHPLAKLPVIFKETQKQATVHSLYEIVMTCHRNNPPCCCNLFCKLHMVNECLFFSKPYFPSLSFFLPPPPSYAIRCLPRHIQYTGLPYTLASNS